MSTPRRTRFIDLSQVAPLSSLEGSVPRPSELPQRQPGGSFLPSCQLLSFPFDSKKEKKKKQPKLYILSKVKAKKQQTDLYNKGLGAKEETRENPPGREKWGGEGGGAEKWCGTEARSPPRDTSECRNSL